MNIKEVKEILICNEVSFFYKGEEYYILYSNGNGYVVGNYDTGENYQFEKYKEIEENIEDILENWIIDDNNKFKDILKEIQFNY